YTKKNGVVYDLREINDRATKLNRAFQAWGGMQTTDAFAAPIEAVISSQAGLWDHPLGTVMAPTTPDAIGLCPLFRPTTSWTKDDGNVLLRTADGRFVHYQQGSPRQSAWVTMLVGPMGFGKSTALNTLNLFYLLNPSVNDELPFLRCLDIGPSSRSIVDLVDQTLGHKNPNIAKYIRIQNSERYRFNPFDTPLGCEFPMPNHLEYLGNLIGTVCYSMQGNPVLEKQMPGMVNAAINQLYERFSSPKNGGDRARTFNELDNSYVTEKVREHGIEVDERSTWHEIRDALFDCGEIRAALIAHRKAMPVLQDLIGVIASERMRSDYPDTIGGVPILDMFSRSIQEAVDLFPMINGETRFELGESRVISLDMEDLVPREQTDRAMWKASIAFFIGYDILTRDFFFHEDYLPLIPRRYQPYHQKRMRDLSTQDKRFSMDERQRFAKIPTAQAQVDGLIAEGRKNKVDIQVASQLFEHHTDQSIRLATTIIILGAGNMTKEEAEEIKTRFDLTDAQMQLIRRIRPPSAKGAEAFVVFRTKDGTQAHHVYLTDGPMYLWLIATELVDRTFRKMAYERYPINEALRRLAKKYPGGSIKKEIENRLASQDEFDVAENKEQNILEALIEEL
ncbi:type IV secretion protein IcmB, partial [Marinobacter lutaoensis]